MLKTRLRVSFTDLKVSLSHVCLFALILGFVGLDVGGARDGGEAAGPASSVRVSEGGGRAYTKGPLLALCSCDAATPASLPLIAAQGRPSARVRLPCPSSRASVSRS